MKNTFKTLAFLFIGALTFNSCDSVGDDEELNYGQGSYISQFSKAETTGYFLNDNNDIFPFNIPVELAGGNGLALNSDLTLIYQVNTTLSTAVEGTEFTFVNGGGSSVIPAGNKFASIKINVNSGTLDPSDPAVLVLDLISATSEGNTVVVSGNKSRISVVLQATCTSDLAGSYSVTSMVVNPDSGDYVNNNEVIDQVAVGEYNTTTVAYYKAVTDVVTSGPWTSLDASIADVGYNFKEVCGRVKVEDQKLASAYSNDIRQSAAQYASSSVNEATGVITIYYSVFFSTNTVERTFKSVYTPN
jgi:hypothetical protein